jgi:hypothetical protein
MPKQWPLTSGLARVTDLLTSVTSPLLHEGKDLRLGRLLANDKVSVPTNNAEARDVMRRGVRNDGADHPLRESQRHFLLWVPVFVSIAECLYRAPSECASFGNKMHTR